MTESEWLEETAASVPFFRPSSLPPGLDVVFSSRGVAPADAQSPTAFLARRLAGAIETDGIPIVRATQVHGNHAVTIRELPRERDVVDAGPGDVLATELADVALVVQTADCVPILLAGRHAIGAVHAGWRGSALRAAASGVAALQSLGEAPENLRAWLGPSIGPCCYEVGGEVAAQFAGDFLRRPCGGPFRLDLRGVNRTQLEAAGVPAQNIRIHPACTKCGGERYASHRRDGAKAGRMIAMILRRSGSSS